MSQAHKDALAIGREEGRAVRRYLEALEAHKPKRGRKRSSDTIEKRLQQIEDKIESADPLTRVHLVQERLNLSGELANKDAAVDVASLEEGFVKAAKNYSERKGISYAAWREAGIDAAVLRKAGIRRGANDAI
jgi:predicted nuclease with TOPRIM domain